MADAIRTEFGDRPERGVYLMRYHFDKGRHALDWEPIEQVMAGLRVVIDEKTDISIALDGDEIEVMVHSSGISETLAFLPRASNVGRLKVIER